MRPHLLYRDGDYPAADPRPGAADLVADLNLDPVLEAMAGAEDNLRAVIDRVVLTRLPTASDVEYRQGVLQDCIAAPDLPQRLHALALDALAANRSVWAVFLNRPETVLHRAVRVLGLMLDRLRALQELCGEYRSRVDSDGFRQLFDVVADELSDDYLAEVEHRLGQLSFEHGTLIGARLGAENQSIDLVLRETTEERRMFVTRVVVKKPSFSVTIPERDEAGFSALAEFTDRALDEVANAAGQAADQVVSFFTALRDELEFYLGCMRLRERLLTAGVELCWPRLRPQSDYVLAFDQLVDPALALREESAVGNGLDARDVHVVLVTGANQGGKSTFLRSVGIADVLAHAGVFVPARSCSLSLHDRVFTHFRREEDVEMASGKLDEELRRMSAIADEVTARSLLLCNESFAATNESEGSEIARQVTTAFLDCGIQVCYVTHLYDFARVLFETRDERFAFLRADTAADGRRSFRLRPGRPLPTSHAADVYERVFGRPLQSAQ